MFDFTINGFTYDLTLRDENDRQQVEEMVWKATNAFGLYKQSHDNGRIQARCAERMAQ